jgi:hypothetical protein
MPECGLIIQQGGSYEKAFVWGVQLSLYGKRPKHNPDIDFD